MTQPYARWEKFWVGLCHGDMHLDNVLLVRQGSSWSNFYIDFADTGKHHTMMDFVVMEVAFRFQSLKFLNGIQTEEQKRSLVRNICALEEDLYLGKSWLIRESISAYIDEWLQTTWEVASLIRKMAKTHLNGDLEKSIRKAIAASVTDGEQGAKLEVIKESFRFQCGIGLAGLAAMHLPQHESVAEIHHAWLAFVGQVYVISFNQWKQGETILEDYIR